MHVLQVARKYVRDEADGHELTFLPLHRSSPDGVQDPLRFAFLCFKTMLPQVRPWDQGRDTRVPSRMHWDNLSVSLTKSGLRRKKSLFGLTCVRSLLL